MRKLFVTIALGTTVLSAPGLAQGPQRDQTRAEAQQRADMMFQMMDTNKDGTVTRDEAQQALAQFEAMRGGDNRGTARIQRMIDLAFGTGQSITLQQFEAQALARFDSMDLNHDGVVTAAERQQARDMRKGQAAAGPQAAPAPAQPVTNPLPPRQ